jgi:hypothetical protein
MESVGKLLVVAGLVLTSLGAVVWLLAERGGTLLPGDIAWQRGSFRFYFPVATCLVLSVLLSLLLWLFRR